MLAVGLGVTSLPVLAAPWFPRLLSRAGDQGPLLDPADLPSLFQDAAGTTPVTAPGQSVGLVLDKSKGLVLGPETQASGWTNSNFGVFSTSGIAVTFQKTVAGGTDQAYSGAVFSVVAGKLYEITLNVTSITAPFAVCLAHITNSRSLLVDVTSVGVKKIYLSPQFTQTVNLNFRTTTLNGGGTVSSASVRELTGFHATQSASSGFRPAYQTTPQRLNFDGSDDRLNFAYNPTASGSLAVRINGATASRVAIGSQGATDGRCFLALASDGSLGAGIGAQSTATIKGSTDIRGTWTTGVVTWDGTTVRLYQNGTEVYSGAQSGAVNTTVPMDLGCLNNNGTRAAFWSGGIGAAIALGRVMTPTEVSSLHQLWSNIA